MVESAPQKKTPGVGGFHVERGGLRTCLVCGKRRDHCELEVGPWRAVRAQQRAERAKMRAYDRQWREKRG